MITCMLIILFNGLAEKNKLLLEKHKQEEKQDLVLEKASMQQAEEEEHCGEILNQQKGGKLESEGGGIKSGNRIPLSQVVVEERPKLNRLGDELVVNDILENDKVVHNGLEYEVVVKNIPERKEVVVEDDNDVD